MKRTISLVLAVLIPAAAAAQLGTLDAARKAGPVSAEGNARIEQAADAQLQQGDAQGGPAKAGAPGGRAEGAAVAADRGLGAVPPPDTYTIRPGDTLWDLSGRFLNNPWYWPKVWSFNPEITNPNWIEPGNVLRFYPTAEEAPSRVEPAPQVTPGVAVAPDQAEEPVAEAPRELEDFSRADMKAPTSVDDQEEVAVAGPHRVGYVAPKTMMARRESFVTPRELAEAGSLTGAFEETWMLTTADRAYARFKSKTDMVVGQVYVVYRTGQTIYHPFTGELLGYQTRMLGSAKAVAVADDAVTVVIGETIEPIERGDLLAPWTSKFLRPVILRPNPRDMAGLIVGSQVEGLTMLADQHVVYVDKGKVDGVEEGNVFQVVRSGDQYGLPPDAIKFNPKLPREVMGDLLVIDVKETASTALVIRSLRELEVGDRVEMHVAAAPGAAAGH